jgi:hypothetical protein
MEGVDSALPDNTALANLRSRLRGEKMNQKRPDETSGR